MCLFRYMKSFTRKKKINGIEYFYEITPYYDKETKKIKQHSKYLGKDIEGKPVVVRSKLPRRTYSYGEFIPSLDIINQFKFYEILTQYLSEKEAKVILTLAQNRVIRPLALNNIASWFEGTILKKLYDDLPLSSQSLSNLLHKIGESDLPLYFSKHIIGESKTASTLIYDITSLSSYSELIKFLEYGHNRDNENLPQVNLSVIVDKNRGIPVMYEIYPGSIVDVTTLKNTIHKLESLGVKELAMIIDRGFYSAPNMEELTSHDFSFIIPLPLTVKIAKQMLSNIHNEITDPNLLKMYNGETIFVLPVTIPVNELNLDGFCYYSPKREHDQMEAFYKNLHNVVEALRKIKLKSWMDPQEVVERTAKKLYSYIKWNIKGDIFEVSIRKKAVAQRVNRMGKFILIYKGNFDWKDCLSTYRGKDIVEKGFDILKNDLDTVPFNVQKDTTFRGLLFVCFIALIIRMKLIKSMGDCHLVEKYSVEGMFLELEKIKKIDLTNGETIVSELTKKHKDILDCMGLCA